MSGSDSVALTLLGNISGGSSNNSLAMLQAIYGQTPTGAAAGDPLTALKLAEANQTSDIATTEKQPAVARDIAAFQKAIAAAPDAATLLKNPDFLKVLLTANGLGDQVAYPALAQKVLLSDPSDKNSLVVKLANTTWTDTNKTYQFNTKGLAVIQDPAVQARLADAYAEVQWRQSLDASTPGLSNALTFRAQAATVTSPYDILGNSILRDVVTTALGLPEEIAVQPVETQAAAITSRMDLAQLKDPRFVDTLTQRYLLDKQASAATDSGPTLESLAAQANGLWV
jgi:hypothetical protein